MKKFKKTVLAAFSIMAVACGTIGVTAMADAELATGIDLYKGSTTGTQVDATKDADANGWSTLAWDASTAYVNAAGTTLINAGANGTISPTAGADGLTHATVPATYTLVNYTKLDVTQIINIKFMIDANNSTGYNSADFSVFGLYDDVNKPYLIGSNAWNPGLENGADVALMTSCFNVVGRETIAGAFQNTATGDTSATYTSTDYDWNAALANWKEGNDWDGIATLSIYFSEDGNSSYAKLNGVQFSSLGGKSQADFPDGYAYLGYYANFSGGFVGGVSTVNFESKINYTANVDGFNMIASRVQTDTVMTEPAAPEISGYTFDGWYTDDTYVTEFDFTKPIAGDTMLYAKYVPADAEMVNVTFDPALPNMTSATVEAAVGMTIGGAPTEVALSGYTAKWYKADGSEFVFGETLVTEEMTLTAKWTDIRPTLYYNMLGTVDKTYV